MHTIEIVNDIFVRRAGNSAGKKLICLHGFADSGLAFLPLTETPLSGYYELVIVDLPGFGASPPKPEVALIRDYAGVVAKTAAAISPVEPVRIISHSIASAIAVASSDILFPPPAGIFSIEGNLTEDDAYFTGRAAEWDEAEPFKKSFAGDIRELSKTSPELKRYLKTVAVADAAAMWNLGKDAKRLSRGDSLGHAYRFLKVPNLYYWGEETTSSRTRRFIQDHRIPNRRYTTASHWPMIADPEDTAKAIFEFFSGVVY